MKSLYLRTYVIDKTNAKQKPKKNPAFPSTEYITAQTSGESKDWKSFPELYTLVKLRFLQISSGTKCKFKSKVLSNNLCAHRRELCFSVRSNWPQTFFHTCIHNLAAGVECTINKALVTADWRCCWLSQGSLCSEQGVKGFEVSWILGLYTKVQSC